MRKGIILFSIPRRRRLLCYALHFIAKYYYLWNVEGHNRRHEIRMPDCVHILGTPREGDEKKGDNKILILSIKRIFASFTNKTRQIKSESLIYYDFLFIRQCPRPRRRLTWKWTLSGILFFSAFEWKIWFCFFNSLLRRRSDTEDQPLCHTLSSTGWQYPELVDEYYRGEAKFNHFFRSFFLPSAAPPPSIELWSIFVRRLLVPFLSSREDTRTLQSLDGRILLISSSFAPSPPPLLRRVFGLATESMGIVLLSI